MQTPEEFIAQNYRSKLDPLLNKANRRIEQYTFEDAVEFTKAYSSQQDELILDLFEQSCSTKTDKEGNVLYDHECISTFENAQEYLLDRGIIKPQQCYRP